MEQHQGIYTPSDDIDLFELAENLFKEKFLILGATILGGVFAISFAFLQPKVYSSEAVINLAPTSNFAKINMLAPILKYGVSDTDSYEEIADNEYVYSKFQTKLTSYDTVQHAFSHSQVAQSLGEESPSGADLSSAINGFRSNYSISNENRPDKLGRTTVRITSSDPEEAKHLINNIVLPYTQDYITGLLESDLQILIHQEMTNIANQIKDAELSFLTGVRLRTLELEEALALAKSANITEPLATDYNATMLDGAQYLLGEPLLTAQLESLKNRVGHYRFYNTPKDGDENKPFIRGVAEKVAQIERLMQIDTDLSQLTPVTVERRAEIAAFPDKPNKKIIIALGFILGGMLGVFAALIRIAMNSRKEKVIKLANQQ